MRNNYDIIVNMEKIYLLEKKPNTLSFYKEVYMLEFTESIGKYNSFYCTNPDKRDKSLNELGKQLLRKHPLKNKKKKKPSKIFHIFNIIKKQERNVLSQKEIDRLLVNINVGDIDNNSDINETDLIHTTGVLIQKEINFLLATKEGCDNISEERTLSQEEINKLFEKIEPKRPCFIKRVKDKK